MLHRDADEIGGAPRPQLGFDLAAVVGGGLIADPERVGDLDEITALRQQPQDFEIARGEGVERVRRGADIRKHQFLGDLALDIGATAGDASDCSKKLVRRDVLTDIPGRPGLQRARHMDRILVHAEHENPHRGVDGLQPSDDFETANIGQVQIEDDQIWALSPGSAQRLSSARRLPNLRRRLGAKQSPQSGPDDRMIIDDENLHGSAAWTNERLDAGRCEWGNTATTEKPPSDLFGKLRRPPSALTRSVMPMRP